MVKADMCDIFSSVYLSERHLADVLYKEELHFIIVGVEMIAAASLKTVSLFL